MPYIFRFSEYLKHNDLQNPQKQGLKTCVERVTESVKESQKQ